ncbi:MAG: class B sortase [Saccharofermentans sp.]|nr:class B sortase [Saccharofermentans sp.]
MKKWRVLYYFGMIIAITAILAIIIYESVACSQRRKMAQLQQDALNNGYSQTVGETVPYPSESVEAVVSDPDTGKEETVLVDSGLICPVDFFTLWDTNSDIYAWLAIPGTIINYPVVQKSGTYDDSNYYIRRDLDGNYSTAGNIYSQHFYNKDFDEDPITVIYGHHMRDLSMFGTLDEYNDKSYIDAHRYVYYYTAHHSYRYRIIGVVERGSDNVMYKYSGTIEGQGDFGDFVNDFNMGTFGDGWKEEGFMASSDDHFLLLSTCVRGSGHREIVVAVREEVL